MDNAGYVSLTRQTGLLEQMQVVANNLANMSTTGFRREGVVFSEVVDRLAIAGGSLSEAAASIRATDFSQGSLKRSGGDFDFAIEGDGFFKVETDDGVALTRAGALLRSAEGELVTADGRRVLGEGDAPIFLPPGAGSVTVATDGAISADGAPIGRLALATVEDKSQLVRGEGGLFTTDAPLIAADDATVFNGFVEQSNVEPVREITKMIDIQRAYEMGQSLLQKEDDRIRLVVRTLGA